MFWAVDLYLLVHLQKLLEVIEGDLTKLRSVNIPTNTTVFKISDRGGIKVKEMFN